MWKLKNRFIALLLAAFILIAGSGICTASEIIVHSGESIQAAVDGASNGSVIILEPGTYNQNVTISDKADITIMSQSGNPDDVIIQGANADGRTVNLWFESRNIDFRGITFNNKHAYGVGIDSDRVGSTIENCKFINYHAGVFVGAVSTFHINKNTFINCEYAISVWEFAEVYGTDNTFIDCGKMVESNEEFYPAAIELTNSKEIHTPVETPTEPTVPEPVETPTETPAEVPTEAPIEDTGSGGSGSGSSHGGSGGASGGSPEPAKNVEHKDTAKVFIPNDKQVTFNFTNNVTVVEYITFTSKKTMGKTSAVVENLKNQSTLVTGLPSGEIYKSFNVWVGNAGYGSSDNIQNASVNFKVEKSWMQENDITAVSLYEYDSENKEWVKLPTIQTSEDEECLYFTAEPSGFSSFVIVGEKEGIATESTEPMATVRSAGNSTITKGTSESPGFGLISGIAYLIYAIICKRR
jgi:PGF-pre-PGF domain-containing protein